MASEQAGGNSEGFGRKETEDKDFVTISKHGKADKKRKHINEQCTDSAPKKQCIEGSQSNTFKSAKDEDYQCPEESQSSKAAKEQCTNRSAPKKSQSSKAEKTTREQCTDCSAPKICQSSKAAKGSVEGCSPEASNVSESRCDEILRQNVAKYRALYMASLKLLRMHERLAKYQRKLCNFNRLESGDSTEFCDDIKKWCGYFGTGVQVGGGKPCFQSPKSKKQKKKPVKGVSYLRIRANKILNRAKKTLLTSRKGPNCVPSGYKTQLGPAPQPSQIIEHSQPLHVFAERVGNWEWFNERFQTLHIGEEFRFVNLDRIRSYTEAVAALHQVVQQILDAANARMLPGDYIQLRFQAPELTNPLYGALRARGPLTAEDFLSAISNLLQSNLEICAQGSFSLVVVIVRPPQGGGRSRKICSIPYSTIISKKRQHLVDPNNLSNNMCFAASLVAVMASETPTDAEMFRDASKLHQELGWSEQKKVSLSDISLVEEHLKVNIHVARHSDKGWGIFKTQEPRYPKTFTLLLHEEHFYGVLNVKGFFGARNYCTYCNTVYSHSHNCMSYCRMCLETDCASTVGEMERCYRCKLRCRSMACLRRHNALALKKKVACIPKRYCPKCGRYVDYNHSEGDCRGRSCMICWGPIKQDEKHLCYMKRIKYPETSTKYVFFDIETHQFTGEHVPNYCYARAFEGETVDCFKDVPKPSKKKGKSKTEELDKEEERPTWPLAGQTWEFKGEGCMSDFIKTFTTDGRFSDATFIAHNSRAYDSYFIIRELIKEKLDVDIIAQGGKLICVTVKGLDLKFIDSLSHLPMALAKLPKALGFEGSKGYFPHFFNTPENWDYVGPLPKAEDYGVQFMKPGEQEAFLAWYAENKTKTFNMQEELAFYCQQDVNILAQACTKYRHEIMDLTKIYKKTETGEKDWVAIDPLQYLTLASVCFAMYRFMFLEEDSIAIPQPDRYHNQCKRFSTPAIQWLSYLEHKENIQIQHALKGGEVKVDKYFLDGYAVIDGKKTAFEFNGCFFHGCVLCYSPEEWNPLVGKTHEFLYNSTQKRTAVLKSLGFEVRTIWEHEWRNQLKTDIQIKQFLTEAGFPESLEPRDALFGGRTNAVCLYYKPKEGEEIKYYDFTSLYPYVNKTKDYPLGHPQIIFENFKPLSEYFGFAKLKILPPRGLFFPVLPSKIGGKLMFVLCATCAGHRLLDPCHHTDEERALVGTWCTIELDVAIQKGYKVMKIYEVWHFQNRNSSLFAEYINLHLRQKQEASGYPHWCVSEEDKAKYIGDFLEKEGVLLRKEEIAVNPAKRQIAKLFLNSLWGKFGQRTNLLNTQVVRDPDEFFQLLFSDAYKVSMFEFIDEDAVCVSWKHSEDRVTTSGRKNEFIACFTTAYARLELYRLLDKLQDRILYHDTDSVIFVSREGEWNPALGDYLGDLTSEVPPDQYITEYVSAGPKTYGYKLSGGTACVKVKGITLNVANCEKINFDSLKDLVFEYVSDSNREGAREIVLQQQGIVRNKHQWTIHTKELRKTQRVVYDKRVITEGFKTLPYGY